MASEENEGAPTFQFSQGAEYERQRCLPNELFCDRSLPADVEVERGGEIGVQIVHRRSRARRSSTGLDSINGCLLSHLKCALQSVLGRASSFGRPNCRVSGGPFSERMTTGMPLRAVFMAQAVRR